MCAIQLRDILDLTRFISGTGRVTRCAANSHNAPVDVGEMHVVELPHASMSVADSVAARQRVANKVGLT